MTRLFALTIALLVCLTGLQAALLAAGYLAPWLQSHLIARWFVPACNLFVAGCLLIAGLRHRKAVRADDERLAPLVRRDPRTGLRQL